MKVSRLLERCSQLVLYSMAINARPRQLSIANPRHHDDHRSYMTMAGLGIDQQGLLCTIVPQCFVESLRQ